MSTLSDRFLIEANKELLDTILNYDSDTFFSKGCDLTYEEAKELAGRAIHSFIDNNLDGIFLDNHLAQIRGE